MLHRMMHLKLLVCASLFAAAHAFVAPQPSAAVRWARPRTVVRSEPEKKPDDPDQKPKKPPPVINYPTVGEGKNRKDIMSRLLKDRILLLGTDVNDEMANVLVAQLLYLNSEDPDKEITMYINSPGGSVSAGMAIYDTMQYVSCDVRTICFGMAASMGAFLLGAGTPGKRGSFPNARIMIHQPLGGAQGQAADIEIQAKEILYVKARMIQLWPTTASSPSRSWRRTWTATFS